jgi:hypothetical protein
MSSKRASAPKARLVDMEVEEVSLVDRAANKRKFLVVKRSEGMGQESNSGNANEGTESNEGHDDQDGSEGSDESGGEESPLDVAAGALDGLTSAMARLQSAGADVLRGELESVVGELRGAADALEEQLSGDGSNDEPDDDSDAGPSSGSGDADKSILAPLVGAMTELVSELRASRTGKPTTKATRRGGKPPARGAGGGGSDDDEEADDEEEDDEEDEVPVRRGPPPKTPKRKDAGARDGGGLQADMRALRTDLKTFSSSLQDQARRLTKLEKRAAPPSSRTPGERPNSTRANEDAWPLDLNAPRSR